MNAIQEQVLKRFNGREIEPIPDSDLEYAEQNPAYIFNIGKREHRIDYVPGLGAVLIPACPTGARYSAPYVVPGKVFEHFDQGEGRSMYRGFSARSHTGRNGRREPGVIDDILQSNNPKGQFSPNRVQWGVFAAAGATPTEAELEAATKELHATARLFVGLADDLWLEGDSGRRQINTIHRESCLMLGLKKPWLEETVMQSRESCPACGSDIKPGVAKCHHCGAILDAAKWAQFSGEQKPAVRARKEE